ncbi:MAG: hypothetical protein C4293_09880 [Nitrospiraceae bacterium]
MESELTPKPECGSRYEKSGKLKEKFVLSTGGDSGIGRSPSSARTGADATLRGGRPNSSRRRLGLSDLTSGIRLQLFHRRSPDARGWGETIPNQETAAVENLASVL